MTARDRVAGRSERPVTAGNVTCADIASRAPAANAGAERHELAGIKDRARGEHGRDVVMRVTGRLPRAREMLDRRRHPGRLEAADHRRTVASDARRVVPERPDPEGGVQRVRGHVEHRRVDDVHAHRARLGADRPPDTLRQRLVIDRAQRHVAGELGRCVAEGDELAALLVGRDEERTRPRHSPPAATVPPALAPAPATARSRAGTASRPPPAPPPTAPPSTPAAPPPRTPASPARGSSPSPHPLTAPDRPRTK